VTGKRRVSEVEFRVVLKPLDREITCGEGESLLDALRRAGVGVESVCGGQGTCGRCRVQVLSGDAGEPSSQEMETLSPSLLEKGFRLACQLFPRGDLILHVPPSSLSPEQKLQLDSRLGPAELDPAVRAHDLEVELPSVPGEWGSDLRRLNASLATGAGAASEGADLPALRALPGALRAGGGRVRAVLRQGQLLGFVSRGRHPLGIAVDLGTTKVALYLYELGGGGMLRRRGFLSPQSAYGEDIVTRMEQALKGRAGLLRGLVVESLNRNFSEMLDEEGREAEEVFEVVLVGNTAMHHIFLELPVEQLAKSPYLPATDLPLEVRARDLGLEINPSAVVYLPPPIAGFVGSDHLAALTAARLAERPGPCLLLDIGTNTEVALQAGGRVISCSCASGPAFEGGGISRGMRAGVGAVEGVILDPATGEARLSVIGDVPPSGICGSGILSLLAALVASGIVDEGGRLKEGRPGVAEVDGELAFLLVPPGENGPGLAVTQGDVREIQKAKGAIRAGVDALLSRAGVDHRELREVILAGAFGTYIDPADALAVSLLPPVPPHIVDQVGNAAGAGACSMLLSRRARREAEELARRVEYLELSAWPDLDLLFAADMYLSEAAVEEAKRRFRPGGGE